MILFQDNKAFGEGPEGRLEIPGTDEITRKLAMLFEGECEGRGPRAAADKFGYSK